MNDDSLDREPSWSPDGEKITFVSYRDTTEGDEIYSINAMMEVMLLPDNDADERA